MNQNRPPQIHRAIFFFFATILMCYPCDQVTVEWQDSEARITPKGVKQSVTHKQTHPPSKKAPQTNFNLATGRQPGPTTHKAPPTRQLQPVGRHSCSSHASHANTSCTCLDFFHDSSVKYKCLDHAVPLALFSIATLLEFTKLLQPEPSYFQMSHQCNSNSYCSGCVGVQNCTVGTPKKWTLCCSYSTSVHAALGSRPDPPRPLRITNVKKTRARQSPAYKFL